MTIVPNSMMSEIQKNAIVEQGRKYIFNHFRHLFEDAMKDPSYRHFKQNH